MDEYEIIIIGAGAAGLMAGEILARGGKKIVLLEARDRIGGRIHSFASADGKIIMEGGAEFIHGDLPATMELVRRSGIGIRRTGGKMIQQRNGDGPLPHHWAILEEKLGSLENDMTVHAFLMQHFPGDEFSGMRNMITGFVEGYDSADTKRAGIFTFRDEWLHMGEEHQHRINGGYGALMQFLAGEIMKYGNCIEFNSVVDQIISEDVSVSVMLKKGKKYVAKKIIVTVPLGILQLPASHPDSIKIKSLPEKIHSAIMQLGFGEIIKVLVYLNESFQIEKDASMSGMGFLFSDAPIATWWTQFPDGINLLTGWIAGPKAGAIKNKSVDDIKLMAVDSLCQIYSLDENMIRSSIQEIFIFNWSADPFTHGSYAYDTPETMQAVELLHQPVDDQLYFAGDAIHTGHSVGTVEAALQSGIDVATQILK